MQVQQWRPPYVIAFGLAGDDVGRGMAGALPFLPWWRPAEVGVVVTAHGSNTEI